MEFKGYIGDGRKYDSEVREWEENLKDVFGFIPFKGTLNVSIFPRIENEKQFIADKNVIKPFEDFSCLEGELNGIRSYFCYSNKRGHKNISTFYVISDVHLRSELGLKNKNWVNITLK